MPTQSEIVKRVLIRAGVLPVGQIASSAQEEVVNNALVPMHAKWLSDGDITWELSSVPDEVSDQLVTLATIGIANDFGISTERLQRLKSEESLSKQSMFAYDETPYTESTATYY